MENQIMKKKTINYNLLNFKHLNYIASGFEGNVFSVAEGAVRAGKTIDNIIIFFLNFEKSDDYIHLVSASSAPLAKTLIGDCNGFGLEHIYKGRCHWGKFKGSDLDGKGKGVEALFVNTSQGVKTILFVGSAKSDSFKSIRGLTIGMWLATEINLHHESFIQEAINRTLTSKRRRIIWDLNPSNPNHFIYRKYIDKWRNKKDFYSGINYEKFTIFDNDSITEDRKKEIISEYEIGSIWYKRDILGLRVVAEGLIYYQFKPHHIVSEEIIRSKKYIEYSVGVDIGESESAFTMNSIGIIENNEGIGILKEYYHRNKDHLKQNKKGDNEYAKDTALFIQRHINVYKMLPRKVYIDNNRPMFIIAVEKAFRELGIPTGIIKYAWKTPINDRVRAYRQIFYMDKIYICETCVKTIEGFTEAVWCPKEADKGFDVRLDDGSVNIHSLDSTEYASEPYFKRLLR